MKKLINKIFNFKNFEKAMLYNAFLETDLTTSDYINLINILKNYDKKNTNN